MDTRELQLLTLACAFVYPIIWLGIKLKFACPGGDLLFVGVAVLCRSFVCFDSCDCCSFPLSISSMLCNGYSERNA